MAKINHLSHGLADLEGHHVPGNVARDGAPKRVHAIEVAFNQRTRSGSTDILTGAAKRLAAVATSFRQRSRGPNPGANLNALGQAMLAEALKDGGK